MKRAQGKYGGAMYVLESGREIHANWGVLGIADQVDGPGTLTQGFDDTVHGAEDDSIEHALDPDVVPMTLAERREVAADVIAQWVAWAEDER
jgi:hypothetical protein